MNHFKLQRDINKIMKPDFFDYFISYFSGEFEDYIHLLFYMEEDKKKEQEIKNNIFLYQAVKKNIYKFYNLNDYKKTKILKLNKLVKEIERKFFL